MEKQKIKFKLEKDKDGYPPAEVESIWVKDLGNGSYEIDNSPFYARNISWKDIVSAEQRDGELWYKETLTPSDHSTMRVYFHKECSFEDRENILHFLNDSGATYESFAKDYPLYAVDLSPEVDYRKLITYLREKEKNNLLGVEESSYRHKL